MFQRLGSFCLALCLIACSRSNETWEDVKTAGRYMQRGVDSLLGKEYESKMLSENDEFYGPYDEDFLPLRDSDLKFAGMDSAIPQPRAIPGQNGVPSLTAFYEPPSALKNIFGKVHFETDEHIVRSKAEISSLMQLADYMKTHSGVYLMIEGHTDERASAGYNQALGMRRANFVRSFLVKNGVDLNRVYTVSRGKEQPVAMGHSVDDWKVNRRSEFKMYEIR